MEKLTEHNLRLGSPPLPTVLLRHDICDGTSHFDWMICPDSNVHCQLISFRVAGRIDQLSPGESMRLERIGDHRHAFLTFEGDIGGGRGLVTRVASGTITAWRLSPGSKLQWTLDIGWESHETSPQSQCVILEREESSIWRLLSTEILPESVTMAG